MSITGETLEVASGTAGLAMHAASSAVRESEERTMDLLLKVAILGGLVAFVAIVIRKRLCAPPEAPPADEPAPSEGVDDQSSA